MHLPGDGAGLAGDWIVEERVTIDVTATLDGEVLGEIVVVVAGRSADAAAEGEVDELAADAVARALLSQGQSPSAVAKELRRRLGISRNDAYRIAQDAAGEA